MRFNIKETTGRFAKYLRETRFELKKIIWPGRRETFVFTSVVVISVIIVSGAIWIMDTLFSSVVGFIIR